jgi:DNA-binding LacI/PurR family transcriptional regulator
MSKRSQPVPATMADIARLAGVSSSTVSRALAGSPLVATTQRDAIVRLAREHGYVVNTTARNLRLQRTETLSVVIPLGHEASQPLTDPFFAEMLGHLADEITRRGYGMFLRKVLPPMDGWLPSIIASGRSDGIIVIGQSTEHAALEAAAARYAPLVVWGGRLARQTYCTVGTDNVGGALAAVNHLLALGRRRILFLGDLTGPEIGLRHQGYRQGLERVGLEPQHAVPAQLTADAAYETMQSLLATRRQFDAVLAASDVIAISAIRAIIAAGLRVPEDVAVAGFDDVAFAKHTNPPLTTVRQDLARGARLLVDLAFRRMAGEDAPSVTMPAELVVRESTVGNPSAPAPATAAGRR